MEEKGKTKEELLNELSEARRRIAELEASKSERKKAEEMLKLFLQATETSVDGIAMGNLEGRITYANEAFVKMFGYSKEELIGKEIASIHSEDQKPILAKALEATLKSGWIGELVGQRKNGELFPVAISTSRVTDDEGKVIADMAVHRDITERKRAEEVLRESGEKLQYIIDNACDIIFNIDLKGNYTFANKATERITGYPIDKLLRMNMYELVAPEYHQFIRERMMRRISGEPLEKPFDFEIVHKNGHRVVVELTTSRIRDKDEKLVGVQGIARDVTEGKRAEEEINRVAQEWKTTFDSITDLIAIQDKDFKLIRVNKAYSDVLKKKPKELIGKACYEVIHGTKEPWPDCPVRQARETKKTSVTEFFEPRLGIHLEVQASPILGENGEFVGIVHIARDVTERKKAEEESKERTDRLKRFHNLTVGRELEMIKLKEEINFLLEKLGQPGKYKVPEKARKSE